MKAPDRQFELVPQIGVGQYEDLLESFYKRVLFDVVDPEDGLPLVTDESSLSHFANCFGGSPTTHELLDRIATSYGVSCHDLRPPLLLPILERLRGLGK
jgi:hypothetical protein